MNKTIEVVPPFPIKGDGSSIWGESKGTFRVDKIVVDWDKEEECGNVDMFGKGIKSCQYTDDGIEKEVIKLLPLIAKHIGRPLESISWSEYGMQSEKGWNFDIS